MSPRWHVKKAARRALVMGSVASGWLGARELVSRARQIHVLMYHRFADAPRDAFSVRPEAFEAQMRVLAESRRAVSLEDLRLFLAGQRELPNGACLVTIDDGLVGTLTEALPVLRRWGVPAVAFVSAGLIGCKNRYPEPYMSWPEVKSLLASGVVDIGSHAYTHRSLGLITPEEAFMEAKRSRERLEDELGVAVRSFAYPFGTRADFSSLTERALAEAGYTVAFNSMHGAVRAGMDPISLPRVKVEGGEPLWMFRLLSRGAMDPWRAIDRALFRVQRVRIEVAGNAPPWD